MIISALMVMMALVLFLSTLELAWIIIKDIASPPVLLLEIDELLEIFGLYDPPDGCAAGSTKGKIASAEPHRVLWFSFRRCDTAAILQMGDLWWSSGKVFG